MSRIENAAQSCTSACDSAALLGPKRRGNTNGRSTCVAAALRRSNPSGGGAKFSLCQNRASLGRFTVHWGNCECEFVDVVCVYSRDGGGGVNRVTMRHPRPNLLQEAKTSQYNIDRIQRSGRRYRRSRRLATNNPLVGLPQRRRRRFLREYTSAALTSSYVVASCRMQITAASAGGVGCILTRAYRSQQNLAIIPLKQYGFAVPS